MAYPARSGQGHWRKSAVEARLASRRERKRKFSHLCLGPNGRIVAQTRLKPFAAMAFRGWLIFHVWLVGARCLLARRVSCGTALADGSPALDKQNQRTITHPMVFDKHYDIGRRNFRRSVSLIRDRDRGHQKGNSLAQNATGGLFSGSRRRRRSGPAQFKLSGITSGLPFGQLAHPFPPVCDKQAQRNLQYSRTLAVDDRDGPGTPATRLQRGNCSRTSREGNPRGRGTPDRNIPCDNTGFAIALRWHRLA